MKLFSKTIALVFLLAATTVFAGAPVKNGLVLYFPTVSARVRDVSGAKNNGQTSTIVVSNSPSLVSMAQTHQLSYAVWINPASIPREFPVLLSKGGNESPGAFGGYEFILNSNGDRDLLFISGYFSANMGSGFINTNLGQWTHVAFTIDTDAQTVQFYVNGQPVNSIVSGGSFADVNFDLPNNLYVGAPDPAANQNRASFDGSMREVMLFNRALSTNEIHTIFTKTSPRAGGNNGGGGGVFPGN
jgi:hypothetical protein